jgi:hypothetical protein
MDQMSLFLGLAGLVSTLIASMLGLYYTNKARSGAYREFLYKKQVEIIVEYFDLFTALKSLAGTLDISSKYSATKYSDRKRIWEEMQSKMISFYDTTPKVAGALLPRELFTAIVDVGSACNDFLYIASKEAPEKKEFAEAFANIQAYNLHFVLLARDFMGIDALSEESMKIYSKVPDSLFSISQSYWPIAKGVFAKDTRRVSSKSKNKK